MRRLGWGLISPPPHHESLFHRRPGGIDSTILKTEPPARISVSVVGLSGRGTVGGGGACRKRQPRAVVV